MAEVQLHEDDVDLQNHTADELERFNNKLSAQREAIVARQIALAPIWELKMREERALRNQQAPEQVISPEGIDTEEEMGSM